MRYKPLCHTSNGLKETAFTALLAALDPDPGEAAIRYERLREKLIRLFVWRGCPDAAELTDETINRVARRVAADQQIGSKLEPFSIGVAHRIYMEVLRDQKRHRNAGDEIRARPANLFERERTNPKLVRLEQCILELPDDERKLILDYYNFQPDGRIDSRQKLQQKLGLSGGNLRIKVFRIRNQLEKRMQQMEAGDPI